MYLRGLVKKGRTTKQLVKKIDSSNIPVICHRDIDELAADSLLEKGVRAIINCEMSISGRYPAKGAKRLIQHGVIIIDILGDSFFHNICDNDLVEIINKSIYVNGEKHKIDLEIIDKKKVELILSSTYINFGSQLDSFIENTLKYANLEKKYVLKIEKVPDIKTRIENRQALIVIRGCNYKNDLVEMGEYINNCKPVLIGVDGAGDALLELGLTPDIIIGDMDSISDECLKKSKEIIVHAYPDGSAPGLSRVNLLGLNAKVFPFPGTSEDVAMLLAYEKKADLIVTLGTHSNIIDFLEKGREGMGSTMLTRLLVGPKLLDLSGVSKLGRYPTKR